MKRSIIIFALLTFLSFDDVFSQNALMFYHGVNIDSLRNTTSNLILLPEAKVYSNKRKGKKESQKYDKLVRNFKKVYPYAKEVAVIYMHIDDSLARMDSDRQRRKYMDMREAQIMAHYKPIMSKWTLSQGMLFVKLLDRECGSTAYEVIKALKGGFVAGSCQAFAKLFGNNLKKSYDSEVSDKSIEYLVKQYEAGMLS